MQIENFNHISDFNKIDHTFDRPFAFCIKGKELFCPRVLRLMPKKRIVAEGVWCNNEVVVKIFLKSGDKYTQRELQGYQLLTDAKLITPKILFAGQADNDVSVIVYPKLVSAKSFSHARSNKPAEIIFEQIKNIQSVITSLHKNNLIQTDIHLGNFLVSANDVFIIDTASIKHETDQKNKLLNLASFFSQLPIDLNDNITHWVKRYCLQTEVSFDAALWKNFQKQLLEKRQNRANECVEKCLRNSTAFVSHKTLSLRYSYQREVFSNDLSSFLSSPEKYIQKNKINILKAGNTTTVFVVNFGDREYVIKQYNIKTPWHFITHCWRKSRAEKSWCNANLLRLFDIPTPNPIAFLEKRLFGLRKTTYFIMEHTAGEQLQDTFKQAFNKGIAGKTVSLLNSLSVLQVSHGDMKSTNFLANDTNVYLLDLDAMRMHKCKCGWKRAFAKDKKRFLKNWQDNTSVPIDYFKRLYLNG